MLSPWNTGLLSAHDLTDLYQFLFPLTSGDCATTRKCQVLGVLPGDSLHWRMEPEWLSNAHGGEGKAGQVIPLETYSMCTVCLLSDFFFFGGGVCKQHMRPFNWWASLTNVSLLHHALAWDPSPPVGTGSGSGGGVPNCRASSKLRWLLCRGLQEKEHNSMLLDRLLQVELTKLAQVSPANIKVSASDWISSSVRPRPSSSFKSKTSNVSSFSLHKVLVLVFHLSSYLWQQYYVDKVLSPHGLCFHYPLLANQGTALSNHLPGKPENTIKLDAFA